MLLSDEGEYSSMIDEGEFGVEVRVLRLGGLWFSLVVGLV